MSDRIHAPMERMQPMATKPGLDRPRPDPGAKQLGSRNDAMLPSSQIRDYMVLGNTAVDNPLLDAICGTIPTLSFTDMVPGGIPVRESVEYDVVDL